MLSYLFCYAQEHRRDFGKDYTDEDEEAKVSCMYYVFSHRFDAIDFTCIKRRFQKAISIAYTLDH